MPFFSAVFIFILINQCYSQTCSPSLDLTPVQGDCSRFYRCASGVLYSLRCPYGLLFDARARVCNFANQVSCQTSFTNQPTIQPCGANCGGTQASPTNPTIPSCGTNCGSTQASANNPTIPPCGTNCGGTQTSANNPTIPPCGANCGGNQASTTHPNAFGCQASQDLTAVPGDCGRFYRCANNILYTFMCPSGLLFDSSLRVCNYANQVNCQTCQNTNGCLTTTRSNAIACNSNNDLTPVQNCIGFYKCIDNKLFIFNCPSTYLFDPRSKICQPAQQVSCTNNNNIAPCTGSSCLPATNIITQTTTPAPTQTCNPILDLTPLSNDCSRFYRCINNQLLIFSCPTGYLFDSLSRDCLRSNLVTCNNINQPNLPCTGSSCTSTNTPVTNSCDLTKDLTPVPGDCTKFYKCIDNTLYTFNCLDGFLFDTITKGCQLASQASCSNSLNNNLNNNTACDRTKDMTSVPGDCTRFFKCLDNFLYTFTCPNGYLFDSITRSCQIANLAVCPGSSNNNNPSVNPGTQPGCDLTKDMTSLPGDCSKFYKCLNNILYTFNCPAGYLFDSVKKDCQVESLAVCNSNQNNPNSANCDLTRVLTPVPNSGCSQFYRCLNNALVAFSCPSGYLFDVAIKDCNLASKVVNLARCSSSLTLRSIQKSLIGTLTCNARHLTKIDCRNYNFCLKTELHTFTCDPDTVFDEETNKCQLVDKVKPPCGNLKL